MPCGPWDLSEIFAGHGRVAVEIGSGMGEATLAMAHADPETAIIAVEVHDRGVAALARGVTDGCLDNVRIQVGDAVTALAEFVEPESLDEVRIWFPDPWPKSRHHKRRLINSGFVSMVADRLRLDGRLHIATDHADYADVIGEVLGAQTSLEPVLHDGPRPPWRPQTKFERAGAAAGRPSHDFIYAKRY